MQSVWPQGLRRHEDLWQKGQSMRTLGYTMGTGITRTVKFQEKHLACYAVNVGAKCGHGCLYCSTGAILRMHKCFRELGENPFGFGYAIVDPQAPDRVAVDAARLKERGQVQLCTLVDAWAPEAQNHDIGRRCLMAILSQPGWNVRILTKNAAVRRDFDLIAQYRDRVLVGLSITATPDRQDRTAITEPNASSITERVAALREAHDRGLRTYGMLCPLLPGLADSPEQVDALVETVASCGVEEIFVEPVNPRGPGLRLCQEALAAKGYQLDADAVGRIRQKRAWSSYVADLVTNVQRSVRKHMDAARLRFLLYPSQLRAEDAERIRRDDAGVIWLS